MKKNILRFFTIVIPTFILIGFIFINRNSMNTVHVLKNTRFRWIICAALCMVIYWIFESVSLHIISTKVSKKLNFVNAFHTSMIGQLFNCITPFSSGGQPMQVYYMTKCGMPIGEASCVLLIKFIIYQIVLTVYSLFVLTVKFSFFAGKISDFSYLVLLGFCVNLFVVICLVCISIFPNFIKNILAHIMNILAKIKLIKNEHEKIEKIKVELDNFYNSIQFLKQNVAAIIQSSFMIVLQLTAFFTIPYFICLALKVTNVDFLTIISAGAFVLMITSFVPLPGGSGGAEAGFYLFFSMFFSQTGVIAIAILIWRLVTFYMPILAGMFFSNVGKFKLAN